MPPPLNRVQIIDVVVRSKRKVQPSCPRQRLSPGLASEVCTQPVCGQSPPSLLPPLSSSSPRFPRKTTRTGSRRRPEAADAVPAVPVSRRETRQVTRCPATSVSWSVTRSSPRAGCPGTGCSGPSEGGEPTKEGAAAWGRLRREAGWTSSGDGERAVCPLLRSPGGSLLISLTPTPNLPFSNSCLPQEALGHQTKCVSPSLILPNRDGTCEHAREGHTPQRRSSETSRGVTACLLLGCQNRLPTENKAPGTLLPTRRLRTLLPEAPTPTSLHQTKA